MASCRYLTLAKLFRLNRSTAAAAFPLAGRCHSFKSSATPNDHTCSRGSRGGVLYGSGTMLISHPFLTQRALMMLTVTEYELEAIVVAEMPGIDKEGLNIEIKNNEIHVEGKAEKEPEDDKDMLERIYSGVLEVPPGLYNTDQINVSMKFGVLKMVIPKLKPEQKEVIPKLKNNSPFRFELPPRIRFRVNMSKFV